MGFLLSFAEPLTSQPVVMVVPVLVNSQKRPVNATQKNAQVIQYKRVMNIEQTYITDRVQYERKLEN